MPYAKDTSRRRLVVAEAVVRLADLTSGVALEVIEVPAGTIIDEVATILEEVFNSGTSDSLVVGDGGDTDRHLAATNVTTGQALGKKTVNTLGAGYKYTADDTIDVILTSVGTAATTGRIRVIAKMYLPAECEFVQNK
jgi:hypothetical protein